MKLIIGIGNPGKKYINTRHNVGYMVVDKLLEKNLPKDVVVKKTGVFMNESGKAVKKLVDRYKVNLSNLWVVHDDLDLALGKYKIQKEKGPKDHRGLLSIYNALGARDFWHVRVGVDNRGLVDKTPGEKYVLLRFDQKELKVINLEIEEITKIVYDRLKDGQRKRKGKPTSC
jgi:PTH1 family peptidyl-tRNA hydrolase